jgi:hypothetical protein
VYVSSWLGNNRGKIWEQKKKGQKKKRTRSMSPQPNRPPSKHPKHNHAHPNANQHEVAAPIPSITAIGEAPKEEVAP